MENNKIKKTVLIGIVTLLLISLITAVVLTSKQEAINYKETQIIARTNELDKVSTSIIYTDNMKCFYPNLDAEEPTCLVYFNYTIGGEQYSESIYIKEDTNLKDIDEIVKTYVKEQIRDSYEEVIEYEGTKLKDRTIKLEDVGQVANE